MVSRMTKWTRRNRVLLSAVVATLLLSLSLSTVFLWRAGRQLQRERNTTVEALAESEANWQLARQAVDDMYSNVAMEWLDEKPRLTRLQRDFLAKAATFYSRLPQQRTGDVSLRLQSAQAHYRAGAIELELGHFDRANQHLNKSLSEYEQLRKENPNRSEHTSGLAMVQRRLGSLRAQQGKPDEAIEATQIAINLLNQLPETDHQELPVRSELVKVHIALGDLFRLANKPDQARDCLGDAVTLSRQLVDQFPDDLKCPCDLVASLALLSDVVTTDAEREPLIREAISIALRVLERQPSTVQAHENLALCYERLGILIAQGKQFDQAIDAQRAGILAYEKLLQDFPDVVYYQGALVGSRLNLAVTLRVAQRWEEAQAESRHTVLAAEKLAKDRPTEWCRCKLAAAYGELATACSMRGDYAGAVTYFGKQIEMDPMSVSAYRNRALNYGKLGQYDQAIEDVRKSLELGPADRMAYNELGTTSFVSGSTMLQ